jgi:hypothetical protein
MVDGTNKGPPANPKELFYPPTQKTSGVSPGMNT